MDCNIEEGRLIKEFKLTSFKEAVNFINKILPLTEENNHHPDIFIHSYSKVKIILFSHEENKITEKDYILMEKITEMF